MCNKLVASPSLIDFHYYYQRDKTAREREEESRVKAVLELISAVSWPGQATKYFECTWDISLEPQRLPHCCQNISMRFVWCPVAVHVFLSLRFGVFGANLLCGLLMRSQYDGWLADCLPVCISSPPPLSLYLSLSLSACACVCLGWAVC